MLLWWRYSRNRIRQLYAEFKRRKRLIPGIQNRHNFIIQVIFWVVSGFQKMRPLGSMVEKVRNRKNLASRTVTTSSNVQKVCRSCSWNSWNSIWQVNKVSYNSHHLTKVATLLDFSLGFQSRRAVIVGSSIRLYYLVAEEIKSWLLKLILISTASE